VNGLPLLLLAISCEVAGTTALRMSHGFTRPLPSAVVVLAYGATFYLMSLVLRQIPLGLTYAVWSGVGTAAIALIAGIGLIVAGVLVLNVFAAGVGQ